MENQQMGKLEENPRRFREKSKMKSHALIVLILSAIAFLFPTLACASSVVSWSNMATPNAELKNIVAITAGEQHSLALKSDGSIVGWGGNWAGQATPPAGNNFVAIAAGGEHSLALKIGWQYCRLGRQ